ncbi:hypothetical protein Pelo_13797 [Pelomyxa schiedti]|nr:hypothetical protein Pelo_13797 [Pelomyxa schiedti]
MVLVGLSCQEGPVRFTRRARIQVKVLNLDSIKKAAQQDCKITSCLTQYSLRTDTLLIPEMDLRPLCAPSQVHCGRTVPLLPFIHNVNVLSILCDFANTQANCVQGTLTRLETGHSEAESSLTKFGNQVHRKITSWNMIDGEALYNLFDEGYMSKLGITSLLFRKALRHFLDCIHVFGSTQPPLETGVVCNGTPQEVGNWLQTHSSSRTP